MQPAQVSAELLGQVFGPLPVLVLDLDFQEDIGARHPTDDRIKTIAGARKSIPMSRQDTRRCELCETRRARRACPGIRGEICSVCCGTEREVTVSCPLDCPYLEEARRFERPPQIDPETIPSPELELSQEFLRRNTGLLALIMDTIVGTFQEVPLAVDSDVREALDSLVRTYQTLESGIYYETLPANPLAGAFHQAIRRTLEETRRRIRESTGATPYRDADILGALVFLQRAHHLENNGRSRGRAFLHSLVRQSRRQAEARQERESPIILP
jgi:hypothetical protein